MAVRKESIPAAVAVLVGSAVAAAAAVETTAALTTLAFFAAAAIFVQHVERDDTDGSLGRPETPLPRVAAAVHLAAVLTVGAWGAALVAAAGGLAGGRRRRDVPGRVLVAAVQGVIALASGIAFHLAGGRTGAPPRLPEDLLSLLALGAVATALTALLLGPVEHGEAEEPDVGAAGAELGLGVVVALFARHGAWNLLAIAPVGLALQRAYGQIAGLRGESARALETFANIVDERDPSTYRHSLRVAEYVRELAQALDLPPVEVGRLRWAGRLHDLGKVAVDAAVLSKPGDLTDGEWASVRRAPRLSARLLQRFRFAARQAQAVEYHRERLDGRGYYGVPAADVPLASHFLIVADAYDAMTSDRPYRPGLTQEQAIAEIARNVGSQFHPTIAKAFIALRRGLDPLEELTIAEVAELKAATARRPARALRDAGGAELAAPLGVVVALVGIGLDVPLVAAGGVALAVSAFGVGVLGRLRGDRLARKLKAAVVGPRAEAFERVARLIEKAGRVTWAGLVAWSEQAGAGPVEIARGGDPPDDAALRSWLVREADTADAPLAAPALALNRPGAYVALPLRRENSALAGFLVLASPRPLPRHVEHALRVELDTLGLALAERPGDVVSVAPGRPSALVRRPGKDVSLLTWGDDLAVAEEAADLLAEAGVSVEVVDLGPEPSLEEDVLFTSVRKTSKALIAGNGGLESEIAAALVERAFEHLDAPVRRLRGTSLDDLVVELRDLAEF